MALSKARAPASAARSEAVGLETAALVAWLQDAQPERRLDAALQLAARPGVEPALGARLLQEADERVRRALLTGLTTQATPEAATALVPLLRSEDATLRNGAIEALAAMPAAVAPEIDRLLEDPDPDVRIFVVNLMAELRHPAVGDWLLQVLRADAHANVVAAAMEALAEAGDERHLEPLGQAAQRFPQEPFLGFAAEIAIARIRRP
jgi:HEAT repeat protein